eukprot:1159523-Pelagomonas_calceolata.AAC.6
MPPRPGLWNYSVALQNTISTPGLRLMISWPQECRCACETDLTPSPLKVRCSLASFSCTFKFRMMTNQPLPAMNDLKSSLDSLALKPT